VESQIMSSTTKTPDKRAGERRAGDPSKDRRTGERRSGSERRS